MLGSKAEPTGCIERYEAGWNQYEDCGKCEYCLSVEKEKGKKRWVEKIGLKAFEEFYFERFEVHAQNKTAFEKCKSFDFAKDNVYIYGECGTGKSHLAYSIIKKFNVSDSEVVKQTELIRKFRGKEADEEEKLISFYSKIPMLFIDDLGVGRSTEFANQILYEIIDKRMMNYVNGLIVTSNLSLDDLSKKMDDDRLASRIVGLCEIVKISGVDRRIK